MEDAFGFLDASTDRREKELLEKERSRELTLEEFRDMNSRIDTLDDRIRKKEAKREQLQKTLRIMADKRHEEEKSGKEEYGDWKRPQVMEAVLEQDRGEAEENDEEQEKNIKKL